MTPKSIQAMIDQALLKNSTNGDGSHNSHRDNRRNVQTARPCFYADFMKCQPLNFKGTEGVVSLTRWIEKMESVFNISGCAIENQIRDHSPRGICNDLGSTQEKDDGQERQAARTQDVWMKLLNWPNDCEWIRTPHPTRKDNLTTKGRLMIHPETTMVTSNNPSRDKIVLSKQQNVANTQKGNGEAPKGNSCFECGAPGHFKRDCPKLKNKDGENGNAQGWVYAVRNEEKRGNASGNPDANVVTGTFLLNNHYASILFDTGADRSFISTAFSSLINITPTPLENNYDVELADGKIVGIDTII
ncbi:putative reverse transcriptase domain-containing protein [Tanacetum coccineum]